MSIKGQSYLYPTAEGVWMFQIFIPAYMRHIFGGKRLYRKSTGTKNLAAAKHFRNHMLIERKTLKERYPQIRRNGAYKTPLPDCVSKPRYAPHSRQCQR